MAEAVLRAARSGVPVFGICGGYQMLGEHLSDLAGVAGDAGEEEGLGLLPIRTVFEAEKVVRQVTAVCGDRRWLAYEMHMGRSRPTREHVPLLLVEQEGRLVGEGSKAGQVWGTYLHGCFEVPEMRRLVATAAGIKAYRSSSMTWAEKRQGVYAAMAEHLERHVDLAPVRAYLGL